MFSLRTLTVLALLSATTACADDEPPFILERGAAGACGAVVEGADPSEVDCPSACPIAVQAFRVRNPETCQRASLKYVACVRAGGGGGTPGAGVLDTPEGAVFVDNPALDCNRPDGEGCAPIDTTVTDRWSTCNATDTVGCECVCEGGECAYHKFKADLDACGLPTPCEALTEGSSTAVLQCYMDSLANGGPAKVDIDYTTEHDVTGETVTGHQVLYVSGGTAMRLDEVAFDKPLVQCELQNSNFFLTCDPEDPTDLNIEDENGMITRVPCTDPRAWVLRCDAEEPMCP